MKKTAGMLKSKTASISFKVVTFYGMLVLLILAFLGCLLFSYLQSQFERERKQMLAFTGGFAFFSIHQVCGGSGAFVVFVKQRMLCADESTDPGGFADEVPAGASQRSQR